MATANGNSVAAAGDAKIDGLLQGGQWDFGAGAHLLTYSFNLSGVPGSGNWTAAQMAGVRAAFAAWSAVANIQFKQVQSGTYFYQSTADIALSLTGRNLQDKEGGTVGMGMFPDPVDAQNSYSELSTDLGRTLNASNYANPTGDIFFDNIKGDDVRVNNFAVLNPGGFTLELMMHEIGHALGLKHPHDGGDNGKPTFPDLGIGDLDTDYNTLMSYNREGQYIDWGHPSTPMPLDILAMQYLYGVNRTTSSGNNTYYFRDNGNVQTIWDTGGYDTLDASRLPAQNLNGYNTIDLRPGQISRYVETKLGPEGEQAISAIAMSYTPTETQDGPVAPIDNLIERAIGSAGIDQIYGNDADNALYGGASNDTLQDTTGNDLLDGGTGADVMTGGVGDDTYVMDNAGDQINENAGEGSDTVKTSVVLSGLIANVENYIYTGASTAAWNLTGTDDNNYFATGAGKDTLAGGGGDDTLNGGTNADDLTGGIGDDTYYIDNIGDAVHENAGEGNDTVRSTVPLTKLIDNVENYIYTGAANWSFTGSDDANLLTGGSGKDNLIGKGGNDTLDGGLGADAMAGGTGDDTYYVDNAGDKITEAANEGTDLVKSSITLNLTSANFAGQAIENVTLTGLAAINVIGNAIGNELTGNSAANIIDGGVGADKMAGGLGNDTYIIDDVGDQVTEDADAGIDTVKSSLLIAGPIDNVENYTYTGGSDWQFTGTNVANVLTGGSGKDKLDGGAGADTLAGGVGDDTYYIDNAGDKVIEAGKQGIDTIFSTVGINLAAGTFLGQEIENLTLTGSADINVTGNALGNTLTGNDGNNVIDGGTGADKMTGGLGDDTYVIDNIGDQVIEVANGGNDTIRSSVILGGMVANVENYIYAGALAWSFNGDDENNRITGGNGKNTLTGGDGDDALTGGTSTDSLTGGDGNDTLNGGAGADVMAGGKGDDTYYVDNAGDKITENATEGNDTVKSSIAINLAAGSFQGQEIENVILTGAVALNVTGNALNNELAGNDGANIIDGGTGADKMAGGLGNDTYIVDDAGDMVTEAANAGIDTVKTVIAFNSAIANVENYIFTGSGNWQFTGNDLNNAITSGGGNDKLDGGAGADILTGAAGNDTYYIDNAGDKVIESAKQGTDTIISTVSINLAAGAFLGQEIENVILTGSSDINVTGNALANTLTGNDGDNLIDGGAGADTMTGGLGDDTYIIDNINDQVIEQANGGSDTVRSALTFTKLIDNIENYVYTGAAAWTFSGTADDNQLTGGKGKNTLSGGDGDDVLIGGASVDTLDGGTGDDTLNGGGGADIMTGGAGDDTYVIDNVGDKVTELTGQGNDTLLSSIAINLAAGGFLGQEIENVILSGTAALATNGNQFDNHLIGNAGANVLSGGDGNDTLDGGAGADTMTGGAGNDTYVVDNAGDKVNELAGQGTDTILSSIDIDLNDPAFAFQEIENVRLTGTIATKIVGNSLANTLVGNERSNIIDGRNGADLMAGGLGDDTYYIDDKGDVVTEESDAGIDTVITSVAISKAFDNVEIYTFTGAGNWTFIGNDQANWINGGAGNDILDGATGADRLAGGIGNDTYYVDNADDEVTEHTGQGTDTIISSISIDLTSPLYFGAEIENVTLSGKDALTGAGNKLDNIITGNAENNILAGGGGSDTLIGGDGDDTYIINDINDAAVTKVVEKAGGGTDLIITKTSISLASGYWVGQEIENVTIASGLSSSISVTGNKLDNIIIGNTAANSLDGSGGADTLIGGDGNDSYYVDSGGDKVIEAAGGGTDSVYAGVGVDLTSGSWLDQEIENVALTGADTIGVTGNGLDNVLTGNSAANTLTGGNGNDKLDGGAGADVMVGGQGDDTFVVDNAGDVVIENAGEGNDTVRSSLVSLGIIANIENYTYTGSSDWSFTGDGVDNVITGGDGDDTLDGGAGADVMVGGRGDDTYFIDNLQDKIVEAAGAGSDSVKTSLMLATSFANVENYYYLGSDDWTFAGNDSNNIIIGGSGDDVLSGGLGADTLYGGDGNDTLDSGNSFGDTLVGGSGDDTYIVYEPNYTIHEDTDQGIDTVVLMTVGYASFTLGANIENLDMSHTISGYGVGNAANNVITGGKGDDTLYGGLGADTLIGGAGNDIYYVDDIGDLIIEDPNAGIDTVQTSIPIANSIANVENYSYNAPFDPTTYWQTAYWTFTGTAQDNIITSNAAATLDGGDGNDVLRVSTTATLGSTVLRGGNGDDQLICDTTGGDRLEGGAGSDILIGSYGGDYFDGGDGIDTVSYESGGLGGVNVSLQPGATNTGGAQGDTLINIENLIGSGQSDTLIGNSGNNILDSGGYGSDVLIGGGGYDTYKFDGAYSDHSTINNASGAGTTSGELDLGRNATEQSLWFSISNQDLVISFIQTNGCQITIKGWFGSDPSARLSEIVLSDGSKLDSGLMQLIGAMADYAAKVPAFNPTGQYYHYLPTDANLQNAIATAWHH